MIMTNAFSPFGSSKSLNVLSRLLLPPRTADAPLPFTAADLGIADISREEFDEMLALASSHHVVMRGLEVFLRIMRQAGDDGRARRRGRAHRERDVLLAANLRHIPEARLRPHRN